jgi:peptidoglycan hydrolase-like protein with peptidoglycan-binding domain
MSFPFPRTSSERRRERAAALLVAAVLAAGACTSAGDRELAAASTRPTTTTSTTTSTTSTTLPPTTTAPPPPPGLAQGAQGDEVRALEQRLVDLHFDPGKLDGVYDTSTHHAVMAFQKTHGMERNGRATPDVLERVHAVGDPPAMLADGGANRVEVDLKRQVLFLYKGGALLRILSISSGNNKRYCVDGQCATAVTPGGSFKVNRRIRGLRVSRLGKLYNPLYFNGGIAIHGAPSVPAYPASHGCVRIPMHTSAWFFDTVPNGTPVYVLGGKRAPVPFNEQAPPADGTPASTTSTPPPPPSTTPPTAETTTSTTAPAETTTTSSPPPTSTTSTSTTQQPSIP